MDTPVDLEVFIAGQWVDAASVELRSAVELGWSAATETQYGTLYVVEHDGRVDAAALSVNVPVSFEGLRAATWPPFLMDLLPQGYGRQELLRQLGLPETATATADWQLLMAGAGNPIGNIRVRQAAERLRGHALTDRRGFTEGEVIDRGEVFSEYLATHGLFVAGSSGVQGEWPKILLAEGRDGLFYLDHALPDEDTAGHWLVKFARGSNEALATILRLEAPYMALARHLGLHVQGEMRGTARTLFIPRFDREVVGHDVRRYAQESVASLCGLAGFGLRLTHNTVCERLAAVCTHPSRDVAEYLRRDVANVVLGNKDNHARNTAIQRREDGFIGLTPLFDFVPMMLHPDGIPRLTRWENDDDGGYPRWASVAAQAASASGIDQGLLVDALRKMVEPLQTLRKRALEIGVDAAVMDMQRAAIDDVIAQLRVL
ncbi:serine/threonine-protein kinase HipA [Luteibacter sp. UNCMF331Sha3.1]|nr:serine/threonine-protein kinase HipA [Luteibacter sp. UNCMF331Sha3.1]